MTQLSEELLLISTRVRQLEKENENLRNELATLKMKKADEEGQGKSEIAFFIKQKRIQMGFSQTSLSHEIGVSPQSLSNYEKGQGKIENMREVARRIKILFKKRGVFHGIQNHV